MAEVIATENLYLNADRSKVVREDSTEQAFQLAAKDTVIPAWAVEKFGLESGTISKKKSGKSDEDGEKASGPTSNKSAKAEENK